MYTDAMFICYPSHIRTLTACTELNKVLSVDQLHCCIMKKYDIEALA